MATTLASLTDRVEAVLMDSGNQVFDTGTIAEGIHLALGEYNLARETADLAAATLSGLDGAGATTLSATHDTLIVIGAAGYTTGSRSADRAESFELGAEAAEHLTWSEKQLATFRAMLGAIYATYGDPTARARAAEAARVAGMRSTSNPMAGAWPDGDNW
jgi:hypothetical protein